ncbi:MAG: hypothetical protein HYY14_04595 [Candidatus Omnitrophica bacterium]|nr:hypothetical protein [Candidatus Omnitrophota bacterium]
MKEPTKSCTVIVNLGREEVDYLDKIGKDALFSTGSKLSRNKVISAMILAVKQLGLTGEGTKTKDALQAKILQAMGLKPLRVESPKAILSEDKTEHRLTA